VLEEMRITYQYISYYFSILIDGWDSVVGMVTGLCAGFPRNCGSFPERVKGASMCVSFAKLQDHLQGPPSLLFNGYWVILPWW